MIRSLTLLLFQNKIYSVSIRVVQTDRGRRYIIAVRLYRYAACLSNVSFYENQNIIFKFELSVFILHFGLNIRNKWVEIKIFFWKCYFLSKKEPNKTNFEMESDAPTATGTTNVQMCTLLSSDGQSSHLGPGYGSSSSFRTHTSSRFAAHLLESPKLKKSYPRKTVV